MISIVLANVTPPDGWLQWTGCAAFALVILNQAFKAWANFTGKAHNIAPNPLQVQEVKECVTRREFAEHVGKDEEEHDKLFRKIGGVERGSIERGDQRAKDLHAHVEEVRRELDGKIDKVKEQVAAVPAQTMALFDNAGLIERNKS